MEIEDFHGVLFGKESTMDNKSRIFLDNLLLARGTSGFEENVTDIWKEYVRPYVDSIEKTSYGNIIAKINSNMGLDEDGKSRPTIILSSHMDEIGLIIHNISEDGFLNISAVGGWDSAVLIGQKVIISTENGPVNGVISRKPIHMMEEEEANSLPENICELVVDIGANGREEAEDVVSIGDFITIDRNVSELLNDRITSKSIDNRIGAWCVAETLRNIGTYIRSYGRTLTFNIIGVGTVQEEINGSGSAMMSALNPSYVYVIDVTNATDIPGVSKEKHCDVKVGSGPVIAFGSPIHRGMAKNLEKVAFDNKVKFQKEVLNGYCGTDVDTIFNKNGGIPSALLSVPCRYAHSSVEVVQLSDACALVDILTAACMLKTYDF